MSDFNMDEIKSVLDEKFEEQQKWFNIKFEEQQKLFNAQLKTPIKKKPAAQKPKSPKSPKLTFVKSWEEWKDGFGENQDIPFVCHYFPKSGKFGSLECGQVAGYVILGEPDSRTCEQIPKEDAAGFITKTFGEDPKSSYAFIRCNTHKNVCTSDSISKAVEFIGTLDNGAVVHAERTTPTKENIAASLSGKPMSPTRPEPLTLMTPEDITGASGPKEKVSLPIVEESPSDEDNGDLEDLLNNLN